MSTIFISHSSVDNALAAELLDWLKSQGYQSVFLDLDPDEGIEAGERWEKVLYRELVSCSVVLALVTENWQASKWCFAEATHARSGGKSMLGLTVSRGLSPDILADTQAIDYSLGNRTEAYHRLTEALRRAIDPQGLGRWDPSRPLFPGLLCFDELDAPIFFGRRRLGRAIYQKLRELQAKPPGSERLLLVFGPSGSGKSSVVRAGTLPHIRANPDAWITLGPFRPTEGWPEPLRQNMDVIAGTGEPAASAKLREIAQALRLEAKAPKAAIILIIDQFEEALDVNDGAETSFWLPLSRMLIPDDTPFMAMATLRSDFMGDFQKRSARTALRFGSFPIDPMSTEDLREVITGPGRVASISIEPGLVDALVEDAGDEQALPLLALALNRLWLRYEAGQGGFTLTDYRDGLGGMRGLIDREAESTLAGKGLREASVLDAFLSLTRLVREGVLARQPAAWEALEPEARKSLEPFVGARLLVRYSVEDDKAGESGNKETVIVDLVHETLLSGWKRLHDWLARPGNRDFLPWREELRHKVGRWAQAAERKGLLLEGTELKEAKKWLNAKRLALNTQETAYIQAGIDANKISRVKLAVAAAVLAVMAGGWWGWTRTDIYQIRAVESALPETMRISSASQYQSDPKQFMQLALFDHADLAMAAAEKVDKPVTQVEDLCAVAKVYIGDGQSQRAMEPLKLAVAAADKIAADKIDTRNSDTVRVTNALRVLATTLATVGEIDQAMAVIDKMISTGDKIWALFEVAKVLSDAGQTQRALEVLEKAKAMVKDPDHFGMVAKGLADVGQTDQALAIVDRVKDTNTKVDALLHIAKNLPNAGQNQQAIAILERAWTAAGTDRYSLRVVAAAMAKAGQADLVLALAGKLTDTLKDNKANGEILYSVAEALADAGQTNQALAAADKIEDYKLRAEVLGVVAKNLVGAGQTQGAIQSLESASDAADKIDDAESKADALWYTGQELSKLGQADQSIQIFEHALAVSAEISDPHKKINYLDKISLDLAPALTKAGQIDQALAAADKINNDDTKGTALYFVAEALGNAGKADQALAAIGKIDDAENKQYALRVAAGGLAVAGQIDQALTVAEKIDDSSTKSEVFRIVAGILSGANQTQRAIVVLERALAAAGMNTFDLMLVARSFVSAGQSKRGIETLERALAVTDKIDNMDSKQSKLGFLVGALADIGPVEQTKPALDEALRIANSLSDERQQSAIYGNIASAYARLGQYRLARITAEKTKFKGDAVGPYLAILKHDAIEKNPKLAEKLAKLEKEDKH